MIKVLLTEFLVLGILSLCFSQNQVDFSKALQAAGATKSEKKKDQYYAQLRALQFEYKLHLDTNCNDKAKLYRNIGMHFYHNRDKETGLKYIRDTALQIGLNCAMIDHQLITQIYLNILTSNLVLDKKQEIPPTIDSLKRHLEQNKAGPLIHQAKIQSEISRYYKEIGDYDEAILWIKSSIANHNKLPLSEKKLRAYLGWAYILYAVEDYEDAIAVFDATRILAQKLNLGNVPHYNEYIIYNMASCYEDIEQYDKALHFTEMFASMTDPNDIIVRANISNLKAYISYRQKNYELALRQIKKAIKLNIASGDQFQLLRLEKEYLFCAEIYLKQKNYSEAGRFSIEALNRTVAQNERLNASRSNLSKLFVKNPNGFNKAALSLFKALVHYESEEQIISFADQLDQTFFSLLTDFSGDVSKSEVTKRHHEFCDILLTYIFEKKLENKYPSLTSYYIATSKSLSLFEKLSIKEGIPDSIRNQFDSLNSEQQSIFSALQIQETLGDSKKIDSLAQENFELGLRRDKFDKKLMELNLLPDFRSLRNDFVTQAQSKMKVDEANIDFFYGQDRTCSYFIDVNQIKFVSKENHPMLNGDFISTFSSTASSKLLELDQSTSAYTDYFYSFFEHIDDEITSLTLIPDGRLLYFPFETLVINNKTLLEQVNTRYLFSYSVSEVQRSKAKDGLQSYAGFAMAYDDEILNELYHSTDIAKIYKDSFKLNKLPYAAEEIKSVSHTFAGQSFLDDACTSSTFFNQAEQYQILHIANHALLNEINSNLSSIIFTKEGKADLVNVIDIKKLNLNADLTILSACNSGRGEVIAGNGLRSLGLSFAEAGCPAILVNLWEASDKSSKMIIEAFANYLKKGLSKSKALQLAKIDYIQSMPRELQHPKYWANMVLIGDDSPLQIQTISSSAWKYWVGLLFIILLILGGMKIRRSISRWTLI